MKTNLFRRFKWYIVGFMLIVIMLSVGLSFCSWDNLSVQALNAKANAGEYYDTIELNEYVTLVVDKNGNKAADVGDIVTFGRYYQDAAQDVDSITILPEKIALRWIVVEKKGTALTLLTENVVAFGSFWGTRYYTTSDSSWQGTWGNTNLEFQTYYQNYEQSTVRAWLNSNYTLRNDGGTPLAADASGVFKGFLSEAFNIEERAHIQDKKISGMRGSIKAAGSDAVNDYYCENYASINDKVWLPSYSEIYGKNTINWGGKNDGTPNEQFSYFATEYNNTNLCHPTAFASSSLSNFTYYGKTTSSDNWQNSSEKSYAWWWLRSPTPENWAYTLVVYGDCANMSSSTPDGGVRPAVCVQL